MSAPTQSLAFPDNPTRSINWRPYLIGAGIGVLSWAAFAIADEPLGITTALSRSAAPVAALIFGSGVVAHNPYSAPMPFAWDYGVLFLVGVLAGAFVSSAAAKRFRVEILPAFWRQRFGGSAAKRLLGAFVGGAAMMFGARMAGGCASGHGISGTLQLALSSWVFIIVIFASGLIASRLIFGPARKGGRA